MKKAKRKKTVEFDSDTDKDSETVEEETEDETLHKKWKISIKDFFSKCDQIRRKLWISSHLLKKSVMENFIFVHC